MSRQPDAQKFIGESRAPRVQIEYDVELYGSNKKVELPFVAGVMADLSGDNVEPLGPVPVENQDLVQVNAWLDNNRVNDASVFRTADSKP